MISNSKIDISKFHHLYPFKSHYLNMNGLKYHYLDEGSGSPVVMIHGNPTWSFYYRSLVKELSPQFRTIVPDHIGCGLSDKPGVKNYDYLLKSRIDNLEALVEHLNLKEKMTLVLHDWGGMIGIAFALRHSKSIGRVVIMNTAAFFPPNGKSLPLRLWIIRNLKLPAKLAVLGFNLFSYGALFMASHKGLSRDVRSGLTAPYNNWKNRIATLKFVQDIPVKKKDPSYRLVRDVDDNLHRIGNIPMLICWGEHDFVFDNDYLAEWQRRFPDAEVHAFSDAGHYLLEDAPDRVVAIIKKFFKSNPV